ncbi:hypothetical protein [Rhizobium sp. MHM7A]|uniref:hypothetical protein n=1 Tax=Rhizobium sp. MHM7A TaxID=2583233 RepID=UPI00110650BD|nr:hypothetical protein [Rhizobium sp. MHM7A]TLX16299.1 hypothetical protein FFR93_02935 [Rhizobium sp. MHM7A]
MHKRPDIDTTSEFTGTITEIGSPMVQLGSTSCSLNGIHAYYQEIQAITVDEPRFAPPTMTLRFRQGAVLVFKGPPAWARGRAKFLEEVKRAENNIRVLAYECWRNLLTAHFSRGRPFSIDRFRFTPAGDIFDGGRFLTSIYSSDFDARAEGEALRIEYREQSGERALMFQMFDVGLSPEILAILLKDRRKERPKEDMTNTWSNFEERAIRSLVLLAAIAGGWNRTGLTDRVRVFAVARGIDLAALRLDLDNIDLIKLALDKRATRNLYNAVADFCRVPEYAHRLRFDDIVSDLVKVAADGKTLSDLAVYFIYEIALFQGHSMGHVPVVIDRILGLEGKPWEEVVILGGGPSMGARQPDMEEEWSDQPGRRSAGDAYTDTSAGQGARAEANKPKTKKLPVGYFPLMTREYLQYFGFSGLAPDEKEFKSAYKRMIIQFHPDHVGMEATSEETEAAIAKAKEINLRREWLVRDLEHYWKTLAAN